MRTPFSTSSSVMPRRAAHWVHRVIRPPARMPSISSGSGAECGSSNSAARPGSANQADSPVSQSDTSTPLATATAATVNACEQRSGASVPAVTLITSLFATPSPYGGSGHGAAAGRRHA